MFDNLVASFNIYLQNNPKARQRLKLLIVLAIVALVAFFIWPRKNYDQYQAVNLNPSYSESGSYVSGSEVYGYNGVAFYSNRLESDASPKVLFSGLRLPKAKNIIWANSKGALISFKSPLNSTDIDKKIRSLGLKSDKSTEDFVWFIDFRDGSLTLFSETKIDKNKIFYSEKDLGFYYASSTPEQDPDGQGRFIQPILFFGLEKKESVLYSDKLLASKVTSYSPCSNSQNPVCIVARDNNNSSADSLYSVDAYGSITKVLTSENVLIATGNPDFYLTYAVKDSKDKKEEEQGFDSAGQEKEAAFIQVSSLKVVSTGINLTSPDPIAYVGEPANNLRSFYLLDNSLSKSYTDSDTASSYRYASGEINEEGDWSASYKLYDLKMGKSRFTDRFVNPNGFSDSLHGGASAISTKTGSIVLLGLKTQDLNNLQAISEEQEQTAVNSCMDNPSKTVQYFSDSKNFRLIFNMGEDISAKIKEFTSCLEQDQPKALQGYNFSIFVRDPKTDRFV